MTAKDFFSEEEKSKILQAIKDAEMQTSGEIKLHIENKTSQKILDRAANVFAKLKMHKTELRNGVLIYIAIENKQFAVIGDAGINKLVPENFWDDVKMIMQKHFVENNFATGIIEAVVLVGEKLKTFFPHQKNDINEINDEISFG